MSGKFILPRVMTDYPCVPPKMNNILEPLLTILAIVVPLGVAYVIVTLQEPKPDWGFRKESAVTRDELLQKRTELSHSEEKYGAR